MSSYFANNVFLTSTHRDSIHRVSARLVKLPGSIQGQPFTITDCSHCEILLMDNCDQVQIDNVTDSKIFIGASSESIFIRNCTNCTFTIACKQLRTRDCENCTLYLHCKTEPIIETSSGMRFASFNGAYPGHHKAMIAANLNPRENNWHKVYDFNDPDKTGKNWSIFQEDEEMSLWCPVGDAENCVPDVFSHDIPHINVPRVRKMSNSVDNIDGAKHIPFDDYSNGLRKNDEKIIRNGIHITVEDEAQMKVGRFQKLKAFCRQSWRMITDSIHSLQLLIVGLIFSRQEGTRKSIEEFHDPMKMFG